MIELNKKKVCANCDYEYQEHKDLGYDHYEPNRCSKIGGLCGDVWNTTCDKFKWKEN